MTATLQPVRQVPRLRGELTLSRFDGADLAPKYLLTMHSGRRWKVSESLAQIIRRIDGVTDVETIASAAARDLNGEMTASEVAETIFQLLVRMEVVEGVGRDALSVNSAAGDWRPAANDSPRSRRRSALLFRVPLIPSAVTRLLSVVCKPALGRSGVILLGVPALLLQLWWMMGYTMTSTAIGGLSLGGLQLAMSMLFISFFLHELGHISACYRYAGTAGRIGFGVYLVFPVLYADVTDAWKLPRMQRARIDLAGIYFQLVFAAVLIVGAITTHAAALNTAILAIDLSCVANLNPFLRLDGYWFLSDVSGIANLSRRMSELAHARKRLTDSLPAGAVRLLWLYGLLSLAFWIFFGYSMFSYATTLAGGRYAELLLECQSSMAEAWAQHSVAPLMESLPNAFLPTIVLFSLGYMGLTMIRRLVTVVVRRVAR